MLEVLYEEQYKHTELKPQMTTPQTVPGSNRDGLNCYVCVITAIRTKTIFLF